MTKTHIMRNLTILLAMIAIATTAFTPPKSLIVTSTEFANNGSIPVKYTCKGSEFSPPLGIADIPAGTRSLAVIVYDPDAVNKTTGPSTAKKSKHKKSVKTESKLEVRTTYGFTHWVMWNIDVFSSIPENFRAENTGKNSAGQRSYKSLCPSSGTHHYHFVVYALDTKLNIDKNTDKAGLERFMDGHVLAKGELVGVFNKDYK